MLESILLVDIGTRSALLTVKCLPLIRCSDNTFHVDLHPLANYGVQPNSHSGSFVCWRIIGMLKCYTVIRARGSRTAVHGSTMHDGRRQSLVDSPHHRTRSQMSSIAYL